MANLKISQLPEYSGNTSGSYLVMNNSGETTTYKVKKENYIFPYNGNATITGSLLVSGSALYDIGVTGSMVLRNGTNTNAIYLETSPGLAIISIQSGSFLTSTSFNSIELRNDFDIIRLISNGTSGSIMQLTSNDNTVTKQTIIELPCSSSWNGGLTKFKYPVEITGSLTVSGSIIGTSNARFNSIDIGKGGQNTSSTNTAVGNDALNVGNGAVDNTAIGNVALFFYNETSSLSGNNTAIGSNVLSNHKTGSNNTGIGAFALEGSASGSNNIGIGVSSLASNISGSNNIALGNLSMYNNKSSNNIAIGPGALFGNSTGSYNIAIGNDAGRSDGSSNNFYLSNYNEFLTANSQRSGSLMWGKFSPTASLQTLQINASTDIRNNLNITGSLNVTGSVNITSVMTLSQQSPLPTGTVGSLAVSGSNLFYHNGSSWSQIN
jgi:hypothetical protein